MSGNARGELADWRRVRRYAVPRWMIEQAAERRLAGDWAGACAAARVRVALDLPSIAREHGAEVAAAVEDDLRHLVPDLVRWHLPRYGHGRSTAAVHNALVLAEHGGVPLHVLTPTMADGPQHLTLRFQPVRDGEESLTQEVDWTRLRHLWDVRHTAELLARCGGTDRAPFFRPDGTPLAEAELGRTDDEPGRFERATLLLDRGEPEAAFEAAGLELDLTPPDVPSFYNAEPRAILSGLPLALTRIVEEARRIGGDRFQVSSTWRCVTLFEFGDRPRARVVETNKAKGAVPLPQSVWRRPPDLDLLRTGALGPDDLHPLVRSALFPAYPDPGRPAGPPAEPAAPEPVRVRCKGGEWHEVVVRDGDLRIPHTDEEREREQALEALGGKVTGCFAVHTAWRTSTGRLPRRLREQRQELFLHLQHGDTPAVLRLLNAGAAVRSLDGRKRTLLHHLHLVDHEELLPRLLKAGLDLEARDQGGRTPLHMAVGDHGSPELVRALVDAGARLDVVDDMEFGLIDLIRRWKRTDLAWLKDRLEAEHPDVGGGYWSYDEDY
ncbi:ankyrin repeat domain-containing protein [Actinomadura sp. 21ATH]|uniref:ankyrin repeat domain-containing protein n=1 Tax=Actinomadura sp. 21ATH TaxID=1735444 RepID=UPI0035C18D95